MVSVEIDGDSEVQKPTSQEFARASVMLADASAGGSAERLLVPDSRPLFADTMARAAERILTDFEETRRIQHSGEKGRVREAAVIKNFLAHYLPKTVRIAHSGEALSVDGQRSAQSDVLVLDPSVPDLLDMPDYRVVAAEAVFGVIEVKSNLTSDDLTDAYRKIAALKAMPKEAYYSPPLFRQTRTVYGRTWEHMPTIGMIFAYTGATLETLGTALAEAAAEHEEEPHLRVDSVWVLDQGCLVWNDVDTGSLLPCPERDSAIGSILANPGQVLMQWIAHLHAHFAQAWTPGVRLIDYFGVESWGSTHQRWIPDSIVEAPADGHD